MLVEDPVHRFALLRGCLALSVKGIDVRQIARAFPNFRKALW